MKKIIQIKCCICKRPKRLFSIPEGKYQTIKIGGALNAKIHFEHDELICSDCWNVIQERICDSIWDSITIIRDKIALNKD